MPSYKARSRPRARYSPYSAKTYNRRTSMKAPAALKSYVKSVVMRAGETKSKTSMEENVELFHNGLCISGDITKSMTAAAVTEMVNLSSEPPMWAVHPNMVSVPIGSADGQRIGNKIFAKNLNIRLWISNKNDRPNVMYRVMVIRGNKNDMAHGVRPSALWETAPTGAPYFWDSDGAIANNMLRDINSGRYHKVYEKFIQPFGGDYSLEGSLVPVDNWKEHSRLLNINLKLNKVITFDEADQQYPTGDNVYSLFIITYDAYGSLKSNNVASCSFRTNLTYTDN